MVQPFLTKRHNEHVYVYNIAVCICINTCYITLQYPVFGPTGELCM